MVIVFDLDDTLYDEIEFIKSGFGEVADFIGDSSLSKKMLRWFYQEGSGRIFDRLIEEEGLDIPLGKLIEIYRFHLPKIELSDATKRLLDKCKSFHTALVTDGHYITQKNKYTALQLGHYIQFPVFTDRISKPKPDPLPFRLVMERFPKEEDFFYIADNPKKDFIAPKALGWRTIRFRNPVGIYAEEKSDADIECLSREEILRVMTDFLRGNQ